ncbi:uncharacterized protein CcaverHIS019_0308080 [Cutaneotrichosporon cavernicola]|uniref:Golgi-body localization protein domain-containing protein n=1 Tax=Cutaneotrichosporon cavernicola TaxID=279322 RepID=A0AA48IJ28_9TREE|nr:uncharacterized protein CcaverHIS019_0308080 [Cutaneotrichosporon cavernicola]BEI90738.1 hypothetical protein CcaverHIS019_0308080 [Cutaneotrichosporon cavernicola]
MTWLTLLIWLVVVAFIDTRFVLPWVVRLVSKFRITASELSLFRVRDLGWYMKGQDKSTGPNLGVELINWSFGGSTPGKLTFKRKWQVPSWFKPVVDYFLHLLLHHWIAVLDFLSVHLTDIRIIVEELDDVEIRISDVRLAFGEDISVPPAYQDPLQPDEYHARRSSTPDAASGTPRARRHAPSPSITQMSKAVWSHAIGNAIGRMAFSLRVQDVTVLLPRPLAAPAEELPQTEESHAALPSLSSVLRNRKRRSKVDAALRPSPSGYQRIASLETPSIILLSLGIGPATQVFDKDNLRADVQLGHLQLGLEGVEKLIAINKARRKLKSPSSNTRSRVWTQGSLARRVVRALESVTTSCEKASVYHALPLQKPDIPSASSAVSEASEVNAPGLALSLDVSALSMRIAATHSGIDPRMGKVFGTSQKKSSRVHGITASLSWLAIELQCVAPGEPADDKSQVAAIRQADFDVLTTWAPEGFERREALFSDDPELSIIIARGYVASLGVSSDLQLISELSRSWKDTHPASSEAVLPPSAPRTHWPKPPRVRFFIDLGHMSVIIASSAAEDSAAISLSSDGISLGATANFDDHGAPSPSTDESPSLSAEDDSSSTSSIDSERPTFGMMGNGFAAIEPINLRIVLGTQNEKTYELAKVGRIQTKVIGHISGSCRTLQSGVDDYRLLPNTLATDVEVVIDDGVKMQLWHPDVINALIHLARLKQPAAVSKTSKQRKDPLDILPGGLSVRLALGSASIFIGHQDLNPTCDILLARGIFLQTTVVFDYARFRTMKASGSARHLRNLKMRDRLKLFKDVTASAFDHTHKLEHRGAQAALFSLLLRETGVKTVFNGEVFVENGGTDRLMDPPTSSIPTPPPADPEFVAWGWTGGRRREKAPRKPHPSHVPQAYISASHLLYVPHLHFTAKVHQPVPQEPSQVQVYGRVELLHVVTHISDLYCVLIAVHSVLEIVSALKHSQEPSDAKAKADRSALTHAVKRSIPFTVGLAVHKVWLHIHFPLQEQAFIAMENVGVERSLDKRTTAKSDYVVLYIQNERQPGMWDELGRIKRLTLAVDPSHRVNISAIAFRIRIPYAFLMSQLIFNINMAVKTTKLILRNLRTGNFSLYKKSGPEPPKKLPHIRIQVDLVHFEARDHPVENTLNLANRVGLYEQKTRLDLDELFEQKLAIMAENGEGTRSHSNLSTSQSVTDEEARYRLDWHFSRNWVRRIRRAKAEQRRREELAQRRLLISPCKLPIPVLELEQTVPLFRFSFVGVNVTLAPPNKSRAQLIKYMGDVSAPFKDGVQFSLMIPFNLTWTMLEAKVQLRDYPLPLLRILPGPDKTAGWHVTTLFIIAEELSDDDSTMFFPIEIVPGQCGHDTVGPLIVNIGKAIMPTKTYARPMIKVLSPEATRFTWCNSYKPGMSDLTRIFETLSNPPLDPSPKIGFWDKLRLAFHWRVILDFASTVRWYIKGSQNPYSITGFGAGFALVWRRNVCIEIGQPNAEGELVQVMADELLVSIPDLNELQDQAAVGISDDQPEMDEDEADRRLIERRSTKPCARFLNGVRFGLGFVFERTCRPWSCDKCGSTQNLLHLVLKHPKVAERLAMELGHAFDSYEGFRSDYIHFSVSLVAPREAGGVEPMATGSAAITHSSIHMNPKAFAHFFNWWNLFRSKIPAPIRQGRAFPDNPRSSQSFGASLATIKYRCDIAPIYVSHMYSVSSEDMWTKGLAQSLGFKLRAARFRLDGHQRQQEQRQYSEALKGVKIVTHKPFYAADLLLDEITFKGMVAGFNEAHIYPDNPALDTTYPHASDLSEEGKVWYNYFDFIDADQKPFDRNPRVKIVHMGDCPHVFLSRRVKAVATTPNDELLNLPPGKEASKFGHEKTHICYLGAALGVGPMQSQIAQERVVFLQEILSSFTEEDRENDPQHVASIKHRINILEHHIDDLAQTETRHMDNSTLGLPVEKSGDDDGEDETVFDNTLHVHNPRLFFNNESRNVLYKYLYARKSRKREEYTTSYAALRAIRDGVKQRRQRAANGLSRDDVMDNVPGDEVAELLRTLEKRAEQGLSARFKIDDSFLSHQGTAKLPAQGLPSDCAAHPQWRVLVLKPQIALRSTADPAAVVLVTLEEMAMKGYVVLDTTAADSVVSEVLSRSFAVCKGLQAFYPTTETMARSTTGAPNYREMDFVPLEIFLDAKSEATDYDRIILRSDMGLAWDEFNHLRAARGLEWPETVNDFGDPIEHLRLHQNMTSICMPMLTATANATHWTALYYIITDLMMYTLPEERLRKQKVDGFLLKFDRRDRDPQQLMWNLFVIQQHMRGLAELQRGYQANLQRLTVEGKRELFNIRADFLQEYETLNTVFDVINLNRSYEEAREALQTQSQINVGVGNIAWHMLKDDVKPLLKLNMKHALFAMDHNQDGSTDWAIAVADLEALNSNADALFTEVLTKSSKELSKMKMHSNCFMSASFSTLPQVGGISIIKELQAFLHPVRFRLEQKVGAAVIDYIFNDKTKSHMGSSGGTADKDKQPEKTKQSDKGKHADKGKHDKGKHSDKAKQLGPSCSSANNVAAVPNSTDSLTLPRNQSQMTVGSGHSVASTCPPQGDQDRHDMDGDVDAEEMRRRASQNRTFMNVVIGSIFIALDYKRDETRKKHGFVPEMADFKLTVPDLTYKDEVWSGKDFLKAVTRDLIRSVWSQRGDLMSQVMKKTSVFRSKKHLRHIAGINPDVEKLSSPKSPLRFSVQPSTPLDMDDYEPAPEEGSYPAEVAAGSSSKAATEDMTPRNTLEGTVTPRTTGRRPSLGVANSNGSGNGNVDGGDADDEGDLPKKRTRLFSRLRKLSKGEDEKAVVTPQVRTRLGSVSEGGYASQMSQTTPQQQRTASADYGGGASLRSSRSAQSSTSRLTPEVIQRQVSKGG